MMVLRAFLPARLAIDRKERLRATLGVFAGLLFAATASHLIQVASGVPGLWLVAPLGASAVLVFAAPASPLAQPWSVLGGNSLSALVGAACAAAIPVAWIAGPLAAGLATGLMILARCLHPPGGATALLMVLAASAGTPVPVGVIVLNSLLLALAGLVYNPLTGRRYPHAQVTADVPASPGSRGARFTSADLDAVISRYNQVLDVSRDDLEDLLLAAEMEGHRRRAGEIRCADVMSREVESVQYGTPLREAWHLMRTRGIKALPVVDPARRLAGIITRGDFLRAARLDERPGIGARLREVLRPDGLSHSEKPEVVGQLMTREVRMARAAQHVVELMPLFAEAGHHHIPIVDDEHRLVGMLTQSDFVRALHQMPELAHP